MIHDNDIHAMNSRLETGAIFTMRYNPKQRVLQFFVNGVLQENCFIFNIKKYHELIPIIGLKSKYECIKVLSFDVL